MKCSTLIENTTITISDNTSTIVLSKSQVFGEGTQLCYVFHNPKVIKIKGAITLT
jgi:hypothetical protein